METRREALKIIGAVGVTCSFPFSANELYGQHVHQPESQQPPKDESPAAPAELRFFTEAQYQLVSRIADLIIPPTDTPGAVGAGVPKYIDRVVSGDSRLQRVFKKGLRRVQSESKSQFGNDFLHLTETQQVDLLHSFSAAADRRTASKRAKTHPTGTFFEAIKNLTADGYYTSRVGLLQELGYNGNTALASFPEFTIPEH